LLELTPPLPTTPPLPEVPPDLADVLPPVPDGVLVELHAPKIIPNAIAVEKKADWSFI
jgi:hypothetical protein